MDILSKRDETESALAELACINMAKQDPLKFRPLYEKYYEQIFRFIYNRIEDKEMAYDITADVFFKSLSKIHSYKYQQMPFSSWLYRIARNELIDIFRKSKAVRVISISSVKIKDIIDDIELDYREEYRQKLMQLIAKLDDENLQLIELRFFEDKSFKDMKTRILENNKNI